MHSEAGISIAAASLSLRITISSLITGVHVQCKDMDEILEAEEAITIAAQNLKSYLSAASTFNGQEELIQLG